MKKGIIIRIRFNSYKISDERLNKEWIDYRMNLLMNYLCKNLINQTLKEYLCFIEYDESSEKLIKDNIIKYEKLPENIIFTPNMGDEVKKYIDNYDILYFVKLNSDNLYSLNLIKVLQDYEPEENVKILTFDGGYMYDLPTDKLSKINNDSNGFYVYICTVEEYYKYFRQYDIFFPTNLDMKYKLMPKKAIMKNGYLILTHLKNNKRRFLEKNLIEDTNEKNQILKNFIC